MVVIHDACHCVKSKAINLVLGQVPGQIGEQESEHLILGVVKDHRIPSAMVTFFSGVGVAVIRPIEPIDAIVDVVRGVRVHDVDDDEDAQTVCLVHQVLEVVWVSLSRARGEVACHMVSK